jgi:hypothetical protein
VSWCGVRHYGTASARQRHHDGPYQGRVPKLRRVGSGIGSTLRAYHYETYRQLRRHVADYLAAYDFAKHLEALRWKTPYETIQALWKSKPDLFVVHPIISSRDRTPRPRNHKDAAVEIALDLAGQLASLKGEANSSLRDPDYDTLKLRPEITHSAVEAVAVEARRILSG